MHGTKKCTAALLMAHLSHVNVSLCELYTMICNVIILVGDHLGWHLGCKQDTIKCLVN